MFATGVEAAVEALVDIDLQRLMLLLRRTVLAARVSRGTTTGSGTVATRAAATARWWLTWRIAWGVVRADAEIAREKMMKHMLMEGMG